MTQAELVIHEPGWLATLQDLGRAGAEYLGVPTSGAADQYSATVGNVLVGNQRDAVMIEIVAARFTATATHDMLIAVTGATAEVRVAGHKAPMWAPLCVPAGAEISIEHVVQGMRVYLCVNGQLQTDLFLGSAAPDARMGFPQRLAAGSRVDVTTAYTDFTHPYAQQPLMRPPLPVPDLNGEVWTIDVTDGPQTRSVHGIRELLTSSIYSVSERSNHVGLRLAGAVRHPQGMEEIVSHGVPIGGVEIPHSDELIILGRARSLTAGYPIVAVVSSASMALLGQAGPGRRLRMRWCDIDESIANYRAQQDQIARLEQAVARMFAAVGLPHIRDRVPTPTC